MMLRFLGRFSGSEGDDCNGDIASGFSGDVCRARILGWLAEHDQPNAMIKINAPHCLYLFMECIPSSCSGGGKRQTAFLAHPDQGVKGADIQFGFKTVI